MTVHELLEQAKALTPQERKELVKLLVDTFEDTRQPDQPQTQLPWGKSVGQLLDEIGPIEMKYPEIEDPVEWVKHLRAEQRQQRLRDLGDWDDES